MADVLRLWDSLLSDSLSFTKQCHLGFVFQTTLFPGDLARPHPLLCTRLRFLTFPFGGSLLMTVLHSFPTTLVTTPSRSQQRQVFSVLFSLLMLCCAPYWGYLCVAMVIGIREACSHNKKCTRSYHENCVCSSIISWWKAVDAVQQCNSNAQDENNCNLKNILQGA